MEEVICLRGNEIASCVVSCPNSNDIASPCDIRVNSMNEQRPPLSVLFLKENNAWVALWLETNIAAQSDNLEGAWQALADVIGGQIYRAGSKRDPFNDKSPAPEWYWMAYDQAEPISMDRLISIAPDYHFHARQFAAAA
jgi:hypothetical protein